MWQESFVVHFFLWFIISFVVAQEYAVDEDPGVLVDVKESVQASKATLIFNSDSVTVDPGERLQLDCGVEGKYRNCFWDKEGDRPETYQVQDVHGRHLKGLSKPENLKGNECGIVINSVSAADHATWVCKVFVFANTLQGEKNVIVTVRPQQPILNINENPLVVAEKQAKEVICTVNEARPAARIRWFVGTEDVTISSKIESLPIDKTDTYRSVSTLKYQFHHTDDSKSLMCRIEHRTLQEPEYAEVPLDVRYAPYAISSGKIYSIPMESEYEIKYNLTSNPVPQMSWFVNDIEVPVPGENGRYKTDIRELLDNMYMATLRIRQFNAEDLGLTYRLKAKNDLGERSFDILLYTGPAPPDGGREVSSDEIVASPDRFESEDTIGSGTIAAIIVIVVFILILLFIIGVMRYRQMYCFAMRAESKAYIQDPERLQQDYTNFKINEAVKGSTDQLNGRTTTATGMAETVNGNGGGPKDKIKNHLKDSGENLKEEHDTESAHQPNSSKGKASNLLKNFTSLIKPKKTQSSFQREPRLDKVEEGETNEEVRESQDETEGSVREAVVETDYDGQPKR